MGVLITNKDVDYSLIARGYIPPVARSLEYINFFGAGADPARNLAKGKKNSVVTGNPPQSNGFVSLVGNTSFITTDVAETKAMTLLVVARWPDPSVSMAAIANFAGLQFGGVNIYYDASGDRIIGSTGRTGNVVQSTNLFPKTDESQWAMHVLRVSDTVHIQEDLSHSVKIDDSGSATARQTPSTNKMLLGALFSFPSGGKVDIAAAAMHSAVLTDNECLAWKAVWSSLLAKKSIII